MTNAEKTSLPRVIKIQVALAVLATVVTIALAAYIPKLMERRQSLESDIAKLKQERSDLQQHTTDLTSQRDAARSAYNSLANATSESMPPEQAQSAIERSLSSAPEAAKILPRIYIHIRSASQRARAKGIAEALRQQGFIVPGAQILVNEGPDETQVRYFHAEDQEEKEAAKIVQTLAGAGVPKAEVKLVSGYPNIRPRQYEIWFTPASL